MSDIETIQISRNVLRCTTSIASYAKYDKRILLWARDLVILRKRKADGISFSIRGETDTLYDFIPAEDILKNVDHRVGEFYPYKETYFVAISPTDLPFLKERTC